MAQDLIFTKTSMTHNLFLPQQPWLTIYFNTPTMPQNFFLPQQP
jgi:hypothetical protein